MSQAIASPELARPALGPDRDAVVTVRYQVADIERSSEFYSSHLGFRSSERSGTAFGALLRGNLRLILSGPGSSGSRPLPNGRAQQPGGWNRIVLYVDDLEGEIQTLERGGVRFRSQVESGPSGSQILLEDPDGNLIELHQPPAR